MYVVSKCRKCVKINMKCLSLLLWTLQTWNVKDQSPESHFEHINWSITSGAQDTVSGLIKQVLFYLYILFF